MNRGDKDYTKLSIAREKIRIHEKNKTLIPELLQATRLRIEESRLK